MTKSGDERDMTLLRGKVGSARMFMSEGVSVGAVAWPALHPLRSSA